VPPTDRQLLGALGEQRALDHYARLGFRLLDRNYRTRAGEIDLVVADRRSTVFAEVKTRRVGRLDPAFTIGARRRRRMRALAVAWLAEHPDRPRTAGVRIDAVIVVLDAAGGLVELEQFEDVA
jgi:putative endonuclease